MRKFVLLIVCMALLWGCSDPVLEFTATLKSVTAIPGSWATSPAWLLTFESGEVYTTNWNRIWNIGSIYKVYTQGKIERIS